MSEQQRRIPGLSAIIAIAFLIVPIVAVAWWLNRPKPGADAAGGLTDLDVVCLGRVDGQSPTANLEPIIPGQVVALFVVEGQTVRSRDPILKLDDESFKLREEEASQAVAAAGIEVQAAQLEQEFYPRRKQLQKAAIAAAEERVALSQQFYQERKMGKSFGTVTAAELLAGEAEIKQAEYVVAAEKAKLEELEKNTPELRVQAAKLKKAIAETSLKLAKKALRDCLLLAPADGTILRVQTSVGESLVPGALQSAILFRPAGPLIIRAELEQEFLGRVKPGMKAIVRDDVRPDSPTWTGTVQRIGNWVARKRSTLFDPGEVNDVRTVECIITLDGKPDALLVGQRMRVRIGKE